MDENRRRLECWRLEEDMVPKRFSDDKITLHVPLHALPAPPFETLDMYRCILLCGVVGMGAGNVTSADPVVCEHPYATFCGPAQ